MTDTMKSVAELRHYGGTGDKWGTPANGGQIQIALPKGKEHLRGKTLFELAGETTTTTTAEDIPTPIAQEIIKTLVAKRVVRKLFRTDNSLVGSPGSSKIFPNLNTVSFSSQTEAAVSVTASPLDTSPGVTATPSLYMGRIDITNQDIEDAKHDVMQLAAQRLGTDGAVFEDKLALGTFFANAGTTVDKTSNGWDASSGRYENLLDDLTDSMEAIEINNMNVTHGFFNTKLSKYLRMHPDFSQYSAYGTPIHGENGTQLRESGIQGSIYGMNVVITPNMYESTSYLNDDTYLLADVENAAQMTDKRNFTVKQYPRPDIDEIWLIASFRTEPTVLRAGGLAGKTDCISPA